MREVIIQDFYAGHACCIKISRRDQIWLTKLKISKNLRGRRES